MTRCKKFLLATALLLIVLFVGYATLNFFGFGHVLPFNQNSDQQEVDDELSNLPPSEAHEVDSRAIKEIAATPDFAEGHSAMNEERYRAAYESFTAAADASNDTVGRMQALYRAADALRRNGQHFAAIDGFTDLLTNPAYDGVGQTIKAAAANRLVIVYVHEPSETVFNKLFVLESAPFTALRAPADAEPNQVDASLLNVYYHIIENYGSNAESELEIANALFNHNEDLYQKLFDACKDDLNVEVNGCSPNVEQLLTASETELYYSILDELELRLSRAQEGIDIIEQRSSPGTLSRIYNKMTRVLHKAMYFGATNPDEIEITALATIDYARRAGSPQGELTGVLEYAIFLALLSQDPSEELKQKIADLASELYDPDGSLNHMVGYYVDNLSNTYAEVQKGSYSTRHGMHMRGNLALSMADPKFKDFLVNEAGWDFDSPGIQQFMQ